MQIQVCIKWLTIHAGFPANPIYLISDTYPILWWSVLFYSNSAGKFISFQSPEEIFVSRAGSPMHQTLCYKSILLLHQLQICLLQFHWLILSSDIRNSNEQGYISFWNLLPRKPCFCPGYQFREASGFPSRYAAFLTMGKSGRTLSMPKLKLLWWPHAKKYRYIIISQRESWLPSL